MRKILFVVATWTAFALASCGGGNSGAVPPPPPQTVTVAVSPSPASVEVFEAQQFTAMVTGSANTAVTWQVNGVTGGSATTGTITPGGLYTAPHSVPVTSVSGASQTTTVTVTAVAAANTADSGSSTVTVNPPPGVQTLQTTPIALGSSGGNVLDKVTNGNTITCCGGTLGSLVTRGGTQFILSNNHVLARSDAGTKTAGATLGDGISQPGLVDSRCGQNPTTTVANLTDFFNLETGSQATNIDAAIAQVVNGMVDPSGSILELGSTATNGVPNPGPPSSTVLSPTMGLAVAKSGRSTGLTCSTVTGINVATTTNVAYSKTCGGAQSFTAGYSGLVMVGGGDFSAGGDSGSLIVSQANAQPVALLFAGSDTDTVGNPISEVLSFFSTAGNPMTVVGGANHAVIGCTGPFPLAVKGTVPNSLSGQVSTASSEKMQRALGVRDTHRAELLAHPEAQAVGVGASYDNPEEPAILFFVTRGAPRTGIPLEVDGVRTRMIEGDLFAARGALTQAESAQLEQAAGAPQMAYSLAEPEVKQALGVQSVHQDEWLQKTGVQAVGVTSSVDSPGEAALLIYLVRGELHEPVPAVIDGLRTRVRVGSRFKAGVGGGAANASCKAPSAAAPVSREKKAPEQGRVKVTGDAL
jgi:hypothetical protein